jgi:exonuclease VII small subunit
MTRHTSEEAIFESMEEAEQKGLDHLGEAINSFQDADRESVVSHLETTLSQVKDRLEVIRK